MNDVLEMTLHVLDLAQRVGLEADYRAAPLFELVKERASKYPALEEVSRLADKIYLAIWGVGGPDDVLLAQLKALATRLLSDM
jgi:hypothetical protein